MQINEIICAIEQFAPPIYQESYDNSGLQVGNSQSICTGVLLCLDITEAVIDEAIAQNINLIVAHHPLIFSGIKSISGKNGIERCIIKAIQKNIALYAAHTNLDNMPFGVNYKIAQKLGLQDCSIPSPANNKLYKLYTYVPTAAVALVKTALFDAGAGQIGNYSECSFNTDGIGTFKGNSNSNPTIGMPGGKQEQVQETKLEVLVPEHLKSSILSTLKAAHPYEEVAYELIALANSNPYLGAGMIGKLAEPIDALEALSLIKNNLKTTCIRHTALIKPKIQTVAICGGSGSFLLNHAKRAKADIFITADYKYHQFFEAENDIIIADIGHFESEQFTVEIFEEIITQKFPSLKTLITSVNTNPIRYFV